MDDSDAVSSSSSCDVLIVGAGPAGTAAAQVLATAGVAVTIVDQRSFPRDKVCGDALIRDAIDALAFLGLADVVRREAWQSHELRLYAPSGVHVSLRGEFACLPRERFDQLLLDAALGAGARLLQGTAVSPCLDGQRVSGARFSHGGNAWQIEAPYTLLATGANSTMLESFGLAASSKPDSVAGRAYYLVPPAIAAEVMHLSIAYLQRWCPGYGWMFPGPGGRFNIGVGLFGNGAEHGRLREFFTDFTTTFPPVARLIEQSQLETEFRGAPIRSGLRHDVFGREGLLALGEAAGTTYAATGEGIGKAIESGILAAEVVRDALTGRRATTGLEDAYRRRFTRRYSDRYRAYDVAQRWAGQPRLLNWLATRANRGKYVKEQLESLLAERGNPLNFYSARGLLNALMR